MKAFVYLLFALVAASFPTWSWGASTACEGYSPEKLGDVFETAIRLNQRFKKLATGKDSDDVAYAIARKKNAEFAETQAIPCLDRATKVLLGSKHRVLLDKVLSLADSYENMADESVSDALAFLYVVRTDDFENLLRSRSKLSRGALLKRTQEGLERQLPDIATAVVADRAKRLEKLLAAY